MILSLCPGSVSDTRAIRLPLSFFGLVLTLRHREGPKDGSQLVRGPRAPKRCDANLSEGHLLILDGDDGLDPETGEVVAALSGWRNATLGAGWNGCYGARFHPGLGTVSRVGRTRRIALPILGRPHVDNQLNGLTRKSRHCEAL